MKDLEPWFILKSVPGIGNHLFKRLFDRFSSPAVVLESSRDELLQVSGMTPRLVTRLRRQKMTEKAKKALDYIQRRNYSVVTMADDDYPPLLHQIPDPPPFLYVAGSLNDPWHPIAMVGSRNPTPYGISVTERLSTELATFDFTVISGLARGIDTAAHEGALMGGGGTIAVLGSGLNNIYPARNRRLFSRIIQSGAVISEFSPDTEPEGFNFPIRNRIISGMSLGTVVIEATRRSGSLITARLAAEQNREVFAVPGSINSFKSTGTHLLIKQGAKLAENARDILDELSHAVTIHRDGPRKSASPEYVPRVRVDASGGRTAKQPLKGDEARVTAVMGSYPIHIDDLVRQTSLSPGKLSSLLLQLEVKGVVRQSPGKYFEIVS